MYKYNVFKQLYLSKKSILLCCSNITIIIKSCMMTQTNFFLLDNYVFNQT